jgi:hypothetical protein
VIGVQFKDRTSSTGWTLSWSLKSFRTDFDNFSLLLSTKKCDAQRHIPFESSSLLCQSQNHHLQPTVVRFIAIFPFSMLDSLFFNDQWFSPVQSSQLQFTTAETAGRMISLRAMMASEMDSEYYSSSLIVLLHLGSINFGEMDILSFRLFL